MNNLNLHRLLVFSALSLVLLLSGCATPVKQTSAPIESREVVVTTPPPQPKVQITPAPVEYSEVIDKSVPKQVSQSRVSQPKQIHINKPSNPAVIALLHQADNARQGGQYGAAQAKIQRAQRISPRDPQVYYSLANIHVDLEDYRLAEQVALKGVSLSAGQKQKLQQFWQLIAKIRTLQGNDKGAMQARAKAAQY